MEQHKEGQLNGTVATLLALGREEFCIKQVGRELSTSLVCVVPLRDRFYYFFNS
jgi:hypothetical protein